MDEPEVSDDSTATDSSTPNQMEESQPEHQFRQVGNSSSMEMNKKGDSKALLLILGLIVLVVIGVTGFLLREKFTKSSQPSPSPLTEAATSPTPTPSPAFDRSKYTLRVLNGTKTGGLAASVSAKLKDLGYQIDKTGNATNSAFAVTLVRIKGSASDLLDQLIKDLAPDYSASAGASLKDSDNVDAEVIIGAK